MKALKNSILSGIIVALCTGCSSTANYKLYLDTQKTLNKDYKMAELAKLRPRMKRMRYSNKYVSCFHGKPKNLRAMMFEKIACWGKYGEDI